MVKPLNEKVEALGEAVVRALPGKVMTIFPLEGMALGMVNWTVCMAEIAVVMGSPVWWVLAAVETK